MTSGGWSRRLWLLGALGVVALCGQGAAQAQVSNADKKTLAELALAWAMDGGIPDTKLMQNPTEIVVETHNLPPKVDLHLRKRKVMVRSLIQLQAVADVYGDFLYFHFGPITGKDKHASVPITLTWAVGVRSKEKYLSGGGTTLQFELRKGKWTLLPVTERWTS